MSDEAEKCIEEMVKEVKRTGTTASEIEVTREILDELKIKGYIS